MNCEYCSKEFIDTELGLVELQFHVLIRHEVMIKELILH